MNRSLVSSGAWSDCGCMSIWPVWGSEACGKQPGMGCGVWPAKRGLAGFAVFCELPEGDWCAVGAIKIRRFSSETRLKSDAEMTDHCGRHHRMGGRPVVWRIWKMWLSGYGLRTLRLFGKKCGHRGDMKVYKRRSIRLDYSWRG